MSKTLYLIVGLLLLVGCSTNMELNDCEGLTALYGYNDDGKLVYIECDNGSIILDEREVLNGFESEKKYFD